MPRAAFMVGAPEAQRMEVNLTWWGREDYYLNGNIILRQWRFSGAGRREFQVGQYLVSIAVSAKGAEYFARVFVDGELYIEELFPELRAMVQSAKPTSYLWPALAGALIAGVVALWRSGIFTP